MVSGQGAKMAKSPGKPTQEQRDHILKRHVAVTIVNDRMVVSFVPECGDSDGPIHGGIGVMMCKQPPRPPIT